MWEDPIVAEVHRIRREIMAEFGNDFDAYFRYIQEREAEDRRRGVQYVTLPPRRPEGYSLLAARAPRHADVSRGRLRRAPARARR